MKKNVKLVKDMLTKIITTMIKPKLERKEGDIIAIYKLMNNMKETD